MGCAGCLPVELSLTVEGGLSAATAVGSQGHRLEGGAEIGWGRWREEVGFSGHSLASALCPPKARLGRPAGCQVPAGAGMGQGLHGLGFGGKAAWAQP